MVQTSDEPRWLPASCLMLAATALALSINVRDGEYWPSALALLTGAVAFCIAGTLLGFAKFGEWGGRIFKITLGVCIAVQLITHVCSPPSGWNWWSDDLVRPSRAGLAFYYVSPFIAWLLAAVAICRPRWRPLAVGLVIALFVAVGIWFIRATPSPRIDVHEFQQEGARAILDGRSPYSAAYRDIYAAEGRSDRAVYDESMSRDGKLGFGFPYPPLSLYLSTAGYVATGDHRYAQLAAVAIAGLLIALLRRDSLSLAFAVLFLFSPRGFFILGRGWTEPFVIVLFAATIYCALHFRKLLPIALGLLLASKQYMILIVPIVPLIVAGPFRWRSYLSLLVQAGVVALMVTAPLAVMDFPGMWRSLVTVQAKSPFREDALSYLVWIYHTTGVKFGVLLSLVATVLAMGLSLWRGVRGPAGFAAATGLVFVVFIALNKQAFANYYYFVIGALWCGLAAETLPICVKTAGKPAR